MSSQFPPPQEQPWWPEMASGGCPSDLQAPIAYLYELICQADGNIGLSQTIADMQQQLNAVIAKADANMADINDLAAVVESHHGS